ncbi:MAG: PHP domain-containing protein [Haloarculaceae archaeon]
MVVADLHVHTTNSDGQLELDEVAPAARAAGLDAVAITDHDRTHPGLDAPVTERGGVEVIHGIELRVESDRADGQRVDLLGYGVRETEALADELDRLQRDRVERGREIIERVEERLGHPIPVEPARGIGRPDVARAVVESDPGYDHPDDVFADLIGSDRPCYVSRDVPPFERARGLLADACAVVGLAHPLRYPDPDAALGLARHLDAVEVHYPYDGARGHDGATGPLAVTDVERFAAERDLLVTGGSDAHGRSLGKRGLDGDEYERLGSAVRERL